MRRTTRLSAVPALAILIFSLSSVLAGNAAGGERETAGPGQPASMLSDQLLATSRQPAARRNYQRSAGSTSTSAAFMTRPYWHHHSIISVFDHCNPDYSTDGKICEMDGTVAMKSNGVDPYFSRGYAITPGGKDYLYYDGHNGFDLDLVYEPLLAAAAGTVKNASDTGDGFGINVLIDHGNGYSTRYGHMSSVAVSVGQLVTRGQQIGISGNTGNSTGPHLHFSLYINNPWTAIDPWGWEGAAGADPWAPDQGDFWLTGDPQDPVPYAPAPPTAATAEGGVKVSWSPPAFDGGSPTTGYTVTASPGGTTAAAPAGATSLLVQGLTPDASYTFTVSASNGVGSGPASGPSAAAAAGPQYPQGRLRPLPPARIVDTRTGTGGVARLGPGTSADIQVGGVGGVPVGAVGVLLNVTAVNPSSSGFLTVYPGGGQRPNSSNVNFTAAETVANLAQVALGQGGKVTVFNAFGLTDLVLDVQGYIDGAGSPSAGLYNPLVPARIVDTRLGLGAVSLGPDQQVDLQVAGAKQQGGNPSGVPAGGAGAVSVNLTAIKGSAAGGFISVFPSDQAQRPTVSNVNFAPGQIVANRAVVRLGTNGHISIYNYSGHVDLVVDVNGWFSDGSAATAGAAYTGLVPSRLLDTRGGQVVGPQQVTHLAVAGQGGVPAMSASNPPVAVVLNVTATNPTATSYLTGYPTGVAEPTASDLNWFAGDTVPNLVVVKVGSDGRVDLANYAGNTDLVVDIEGWYS
ncbi:MAG: peptidoglycan DD-metalloendopeptidase family protein [Candidatus Dormibacteria bacterium]